MSVPAELDRLLDVELPVRIVVGKSTMPLREVLKLSTGAVLELDRGLNDPVELVVNNVVVGQGEIVIVDGNYGIHLQRVDGRRGTLV